MYHVLAAHYRFVRTSVNLLLSPYCLNSQMVMHGIKTGGEGEHINQCLWLSLAFPEYSLP